MNLVFNPCKWFRLAKEGNNHLW